MHAIQETTVNKAREAARKWQKEGRSWHFHALFPGCVFNTQSNRHAFVLEDRTSDLSYVIYSNDGFVKISQEFLKLHYGDDILEMPAQVAAPTKQSNWLLDQVDLLNKRHVPWHHHMLFPDCILNQHPGKWKIILEGAEGEQTFHVLYDEEPLEVLQLLEIEYFKKLDPTFSVEMRGKEIRNCK